MHEYTYTCTCMSVFPQVLGGVVDKTIPLNESSIPVIQDALAILTSKEIKLTSLRRFSFNLHFL